MIEFAKSKYFNYDVIFYENIDIRKIKSANEFIKALKETEKNPYLNTLLKEEIFSFVDDGKRLLLCDSQGQWEIIAIAWLKFEDGSEAKIWANGSYLWIETYTPKKRIKKQYFYYTD